MRTTCSKTFDLVIASVHQKLEMTETEATARVIKAIENPYTDIIGHPTGRLLLQRPGFPLDVDKIFDACIANNVALEINANCKRLDLDWRHLHRGKDKGVKFSIGPDAHRVEGVDFVRFGVGIARKGWLEKDDVINTMGVEELLAWRKSR
jgi:DNA polymerase (family 10)